MVCIFIIIAALQRWIKVQISRSQESCSILWFVDTTCQGFKVDSSSSSCETYEILGPLMDPSLSPNLPNLALNIKSSVQIERGKPEIVLAKATSRPFKIVWIVCKNLGNCLIQGHKGFQAFLIYLTLKMRPCSHIVAALSPGLGPQTQHCKLQGFHSAKDFLIQLN